jgi:hypothetical protein
VEIVEGGRGTLALQAKYYNNVAVGWRKDGRVCEERRMIWNLENLLDNDIIWLDRLLHMDVKKGRKMLFWRVGTQPLRNCYSRLFALSQQQKKIYM